MNAAFARDARPIDETCACYTCRTFTRAYLRHLIVAKEMLAATLISIHNIHMLLQLVRDARQAIIEGCFDDFAGRFLASYKPRADTPESPSTIFTRSIMTLIQAIILGIIQGLTEFLPISSSAHLVIVPYLFGWQINPQVAFTFDVLVQNGTLVAVIIYFWKDLWGILKAFITGLLRRKPFEDPQARMGWYLILATIPAGIFGLLVKPSVEAAFGSVVATAAFLFVTTALLLAAELIGKRTRSLESFNWRDALVMGLFQALSIFPGFHAPDRPFRAG